MTETASIVQELASKEGVSAFEARIIELLRANRLDEVNQILQDHLSELDTSISAICAAVPSRAMQLNGWEHLIAEIEKLAKKESITAVGLTLSNQYHNGPEPPFDVEIYTQNCPFDFGSVSRDDILAANREYPAPWHGEASESFDYLECEGGGDLQEAVLNYWYAARDQPTINRVERAAAILGEWLLFVRFCEAVIEKVRDQGLPQKMPVLIGVNVERGTYVETVVLCEKVSEQKDTTQRIHAEETAIAKATFDKSTQDQVDVWTSMRINIKSLGWFPSAKAKADMISRLEVQDRLSKAAYTLLEIKLPTDKKIWEMSDGEFDKYVQEFRAWRKREWTEKSSD